MKKIPQAAMPVVEMLRRDVPRPEELPSFLHLGRCLRWNRKGPCCPMGLHPKSTTGIPIRESEFAGGIHSVSRIHFFFDWWDNLPEKDAKEAVDAIWGKNEKSP